MHLLHYTFSHYRHLLYRFTIERIVDKDFSFDRDIEIFQSVLLQHARTMRRINSTAFCVVNVVVAQFRRNPWDDLARKKARSTCWKSLSREESVRDSGSELPEVSTGVDGLGETCERGIDQGRGLSWPHPLRSSSDWMPM